MYSDSCEAVRTEKIKHFQLLLRQKWGKIFDGDTTNPWQFSAMPLAILQSRVSRCYRHLINRKHFEYFLNN